MVCTFLVGMVYQVAMNQQRIQPSVAVVVSISPSQPAGVVGCDVIAVQRVGYCNLVGVGLGCVAVGVGGGYLGQGFDGRKVLQSVHRAGIAMIDRGRMAT